MFLHAEVTRVIGRGKRDAGSGISLSLSDNQAVSFTFGCTSIGFLLQWFYSVFVSFISQIMLRNPLLV